MLGQVQLLCPSICRPTKGSSSSEMTRRPTADSPAQRTSSVWRRASRETVEIPDRPFDCGRIRSGSDRAKSRSVNRPQIGEQVANRRAGPATSVTDSVDGSAVAQGSIASEKVRTATPSQIKPGYARRRPTLQPRLVSGARLASVATAFWPISASLRREDRASRTLPLTSSKRFFYIIIALHSVRLAGASSAFAGMPNVRTSVFFSAYSKWPCRSRAHLRDAARR